jgi:hypothetical protein
MAHPDLLHLFDAVGQGGFMNENVRSVGRSDPRTSQPPLPLGGKIAPGHHQRDQNLSARLKMAMNVPQCLKRFIPLRKDLE